MCPCTSEITKNSVPWVVVGVVNVMTRAKTKKMWDMVRGGCESGEDTKSG